MRLFTVVLIIVISFLLSSNCSAQISSKKDTTKFNVSRIIVLTSPDESDSSFIESAIREELIRAKKIRVDPSGDTLYVKLLVQYQDAKKNYTMPLSRDVKYGEICLSVFAKSGSASGTGRNYIGINYTNLYYQTLQELSALAASKFVFINY